MPQKIKNCFYKNLTFENKDRVVQQWYVEEFIKPYIIPKFIHCTFACLQDRGTHKAVEKVAK